MDDQTGMTASLTAGSNVLLCRRAALLGSIAVASFSSVRCIAAVPVVRVSEFARIEDAFSAWVAVGGTLTIDRDATITVPVTAALRRGVTYAIVSHGPHTLTYIGPRFHWALCFYSTGANPLTISGPLTIDGGNRVCLPVFVRFEDVSGTDRRDCNIDGLLVRNARMQPGTSTVDGSRTNSYGATGIALSGGFDRLVVRNIKIENVTRAAGAGLPGSQGCAGIAVTGDGIRNPRHVLIEHFTIDNVDSDDPVSSPQRGDMDGVLVFQGPETTGSRPVVQHGSITNAAGRAVKMFAPGGGGLTEDLTIFRSRPGGANGSVDIAHQHGDGTVRNIRIRYAGDAHANGTTSIGFSSGTPRDPRFPFGPAVVEDITIEDRTGQAKSTLFGLQYNVPRDPHGRSFAARRVRDTGRTQYLFLPGGLGTHQVATASFTDIDVDLVTAVLASEDPTQSLRVSLEDARLVRSGPHKVPFKVSYRRVPVPPTLAITPLKRGLVQGID